MGYEKNNILSELDKRDYNLALVLLLYHVCKQKFFYELRTIDQLGYHAIAKIIYNLSEVSLLFRV